MNQVAQEKRLQQDKKRQQAAEKEVEEEHLKAKKAKAATTQDIVALQGSLPPQTQPITKKPLTLSWRRT
jgi:hypothetical protein